MWIDVSNTMLDMKMPPAVGLLESSKVIAGKSAGKESRTEEE
jgi:hypothetical protein